VANKKTVIVTGASGGIGKCIVRVFLSRGYNVVANSRSSADNEIESGSSVIFLGGDIGLKSTAEKIARTALSTFGSIDHLVNNAGIFAAKPFTDYTAEDFRRFASTNLEGFIFTTQLAVRQMLEQGAGGSVTTITAALADNPIRGVPASIPMITKGGLNAITLSLASEYAQKHIRFNAVAPGVVDTPLHKSEDKAKLSAFTPMGTNADAQDVADAVVYLTEARNVTGEVLHVDGGAHSGKW
jgi:NAD(P)-dependent dehydrogenase (short-subunit alcohol dehydrogenase family)